MLILQIRLRPELDAWLHTGSVVCPTCQEMCGDTFAESGSTCAPDRSPPHSHIYHQDQLTCGSAALLHWSSLVTCLLVITLSLSRNLA